MVTAFYNLGETPQTFYPRPGGSAVRLASTLNAAGWVIVTVKPSAAYKRHGRTYA